MLLLMIRRFTPLLLSRRCSPPTAPGNLFAVATDATAASCAAAGPMGTTAIVVNALGAAAAAAAAAAVASAAAGDDDDVVARDLDHRQGALQNVCQHGLRS